MKKKRPRICMNSKITSIHTYNINYYSQVALDEKSKGKQSVCHTVALPFTLKLILKQKKNYGNSNILPCKNRPNLQKNPLERNQNPSRYYYNSTTNLKIQHKPKISSFKNPHIVIYRKVGTSKSIVI
jgi:hypothetical protein